MKFFKKTDIIIIASILVISLASWVAFKILTAEEMPRAEIYYYQELVDTVDLSAGKAKTFSVPQDKNVVFHVDAEGGISFIESDCPDKVCIKAGKLHHVGEYAACLPNGLVLKIVPAGEHDEDDMDIVVGN